MTTLPLDQVLATITPLPYGIDPKALTRVVSDSTGVATTGGRNDNRKDLTAELQANAAYLVHAANQLPALVAALEEMLYSHPAAGMYPDGPCIERATRKELVALLATAKAVPIP